MLNREKELQLVMRLLSSVPSLEGVQKRVIGLHDLFVQIHTETGEVELFDDADQQIASTTIFSWVQPEEGRPTEHMCQVLREAVAKLEQKGLWLDPIFERPFSFELVGEDFSTLELLLMLDEDLLELSTPLLAGLGEELDAFWQNLLEEPE